MSPKNKEGLDEDMDLWEPDLAATAPANAPDVEEVEATRRYKRMMLEDAASSTSFRKGGPRLSRAAQVWVEVFLLQT